MAPNPEEPEFGVANEAFEDIEEVSESKKSDTIISSKSSNDSSKRTKKNKKIKENPEQPPVSLFELFRFATLADILIIVAASLCAAASGICLPIVIILYGDLTDSFVNGGLNETYVYNLTCGNISTGTNETLLYYNVYLPIHISSKRAIIIGHRTVMLFKTHFRLLGFILQF